MIINSIEKYCIEDKYYISSNIECEVTKITKKIFFSVQKEFGDYLVDEVADSFLLASMLPALVSRQDIRIKGAISDNLKYHFNTIIYLLGKVFNYTPISLITDEVIDIKFDSKVCATGFSGGVDSLTTFINHTDNNCPKDFRITHLALFNVGSYGNDYNYSQKRYLDDINRAKDFSESIHMPLVLVDSNIGELYNNKEITHYSLRSTICLSSAVLSLQKLFKTYFISSTGTIDEMKLSKYDQYYYENSLAQLFSNKNVDIYITESNLNRVQKTAILAKNQLSSKYLYVCAADIYNLVYGMNFKKDTSPNCSECAKCTRTILALDFLGELDNFADRFDLSKYQKIRSDLIVDVWLNHKTNHFYNEIFLLMKEKGFSLDNKLKFKYRKLLLQKILYKVFLNNKPQSYYQKVKKIQMRNQK